MKNVRHRERILALLMAMALVGSAQAQLFKIDGMDQNGREKPEGNGPSKFGPGGGSTGGEIGDGGNASPLGSGIFLLAGMAGAYAFMRRKKDEE